MSPRIPIRSNQNSRDDRGYDGRTSDECGEAQPVFLDTGEAARFLRISRITLSKWRIEGRGPAYRKFGRRVLYSRADVTAWADAQCRQSTSEATHVPGARSGLVSIDGGEQPVAICNAASVEQFWIRR